MSISNQLKADIALYLVTLGWGTSFILTKNCLVSLESFNFLAVRFLLAFFICLLFFRKNMKKLNKKTILYGILIGSILFTGFAFQTIGLNYTESSKCAFISGFSVILVPVFSALLLKKIPPKNVILGVVFAVVGLALLTLKGSLMLNIGDALSLIGAFGFAFHIIVVGKYCTKVDSIALAVVQIGTVGTLGLISSFFVENTHLPDTTSIWVDLVILSIVCTIGAYVIQNVAQKYTTPTHTALIYINEPVCAGIFGYIWLGEQLGFKGIIGAILILCGMVISELDLKKIRLKKYANNY